MAFHWVDAVVKRIFAEKGKKNKYVCAAGITPSGTVHIGNFREIITVELVVRALKDAGKQVRFIYSWDDYDVFRKVPGNMPQQAMLKKNLRKPIIDIPDPFGTEKNYARHHEIDVEKDVAIVGIKPEYIYQSKKYRNCDYSKEIIKALQNSDKIKKILNEYRKESLPNSWLPISGFCPVCGLDDITFSDYDGVHSIKMECLLCSEKIEVDIKKSSFLKLPWRVDWAMRWYYEQVDFEPGGKDHSTIGGSFSTAKEIVKLYNWSAPTYQMYDFIRIKGAGGKISSSKGNVITLSVCLEIYEPEIVRWLFVGTRPNAEFAISFDLDVIKIYEDFDKCERIYFGKEKVKEKEFEKQKRIYELSAINKVEKKIPFQPGFRHLTNVLLSNEMNIDNAIKYYKKEIKTKNDEKKLRVRAKCAINWLKKYAPEDFKYEIKNSIPTNFKLQNNVKNALKEVSKILSAKDWNDKELHNEFYRLIKKHDLETSEFFKGAYRVLINKEKGPVLANFILTIGKERVAKLFDKL
ncbi:lysine--tRNA ligase [Candidatus Woesearchaeota archaeon]|jgi:lysyl-tRNA synthetase class 1|nr:lysine--tRNA ligase [Candidatus Woesearchaeota archaeon]